MGQLQGRLPRGLPKTEMKSADFYWDICFSKTTKMNCLCLFTIRNEGKGNFLLPKLVVTDNGVHILFSLGPPTTVSPALTTVSLFIVFFFNWNVGEWNPFGSTRHCGYQWPIVPIVWLWCWRNWWSGDWQRKPMYSDKTCPNAALSTTNPTCCPDTNPGCRGGKPAPNRLSYGTTAFIGILKYNNCSICKLKIMERVM
jgi:hypothetical protein